MDNEESRRIVDEWKARNGYDDLLGAYSDAIDTISRTVAALHRLAEHMTEHAYQELASALEAPPRIVEKDKLATGGG